MDKIVVKIASILVLFLFAVVKPSIGQVSPPPVAREFRGVWVATVFNVDWPSKPGLSAQEQKNELLTILNRAQKLNLNAVVLQVRPACDALYPSAFEPWSPVLSGQMGKAPSPYYDPLAYAVDEAHKRGLELHAWFNPFRAQASEAIKLSANHIAKRRPDLAVKYGKMLWLDPGQKTAQDYSLNVILDVVRRYNIDGVHIDDYFYPYQINDAAGKLVDFPDDASWSRYKKAGGKLSRNDWRRQSVDTFIYRLYSGIKANKPWVKFGISPFGIWRPGYPAQIKGYDAYNQLYADARKWLANGWCDYFAPQLYWKIDPPQQSFPVLLKWWSEQNPKHRHLWPGLATMKTAEDWPADEIAKQIRIVRQSAGSPGHIHYHSKTLVRNAKGLGDQLAQLYPEPALVPASPWLNKTVPSKPVVSIKRDKAGVKITWGNSGLERAAQWVVQTRTAGKWKTQIMPATETSLTFKTGAPDAVAITAVTRYGNASVPGVADNK